MNTDRDPIDATILGNAVSTWLTSEPDDEVADQALITVMLAQGVLTPGEATQARVSDEYTGYPRATIEIHDGVTLVIVDENGSVTTLRG